MWWVRGPWLVEAWSEEPESEARGVNPGSEMDVLKSEILRKRQLVEDRNLLVVRIIGGRGALAVEDLCVCGWVGGAGSEGRGEGSGRG